MDKEQKETLDLLLNTIVVSLKTGNYHIGVVSNLCDIAELEEDAKWCKANYRIIDGVEKRLKKIRKNLIKSGADFWKED